MTTTLTIILNHYLSNSLTEVQQKAAAPEMKELIDAIVLKHRASEIEVNPPATPDQIAIFERQIGFSLPADFKTFYTVCNGFQCNEELFFFILYPFPESYKIKSTLGLIGFTLPSTWFMQTCGACGLREMVDTRYLMTLTRDLY
ncbi:SMI1/KNR4 family protein [Parachryseolinea silvisoli]|uniref:SMI1/KNR4 family protein n=1 Tax=Parachryseolinea silvisoli TaxID=2873601 RepID=UPI002265B2D9|nr:SMI1/KNR4 family protein [Parachryseolinea silvisoli]MCD9018068.1 SMI1/KNR4 family protein [Parachryseolinea silvisoli]